MSRRHFPLEVIEACIVPGRMELPYSPHVSRYFGFLDPSGGRHDAFTLAIAHQNYGSDKIVLDLIRATRSPFDPSQVVKDYSDSNTMSSGYKAIVLRVKARFAESGPSLMSRL